MGNRDTRAEGHFGGDIREYTPAGVMVEIDDGPVARSGSLVEISRRSFAHEGFANPGKRVEGKVHYDWNDVGNAQAYEFSWVTKIC